MPGNDSESHDEEIPPEFPSPEALSHSDESEDLSRLPIDWNLEPELIKEMSSEEQEAHMLILHEQVRRLNHALTDTAKRLSKIVPPEEGEETLDIIVDKNLNPDKHPITPETPQVGPAD